jgi:S1-C subfamily serine protease
MLYYSNKWKIRPPIGGDMPDNFPLITLLGRGDRNMLKIRISNSRKIWSCVFLITIASLVIQSGSIMADEKTKGGTVNLVKMAKEVRGEIVQVVVPLQNGKTSVGSGFWVDERGYIATCWHVVSDNPTASLTVQSAIDPLFDLKKNNMIFSNWETFSATVIAKDEINDLALLKIDGDPFVARKGTPIKIGNTTLTAHYKQSILKTDLPEPGEKILLAGYPLGRPYPIVQEGIVASVAHSLPEFGPTLKILVSTVANPGNSGGPVIDSNGKVIGVLEGGLPSRPSRDPAQAQSGIAVVVPAHFLLQLMNTVTAR